LYLKYCLNNKIEYFYGMNDKSCIRQQADVKQIERCRKTVATLGIPFDYLCNSLSLLGNPVRLKTMYLLYKEQRLCVCDLSDILGMTVPAVSQHLRKLRDRGIIVAEREAQTIFYSLAPENEQLFLPYFKILDKNKIPEII